jgi:hypothetical protein
MQIWFISKNQIMELCSATNLHLIIAGFLVPGWYIWKRNPGLDRNYWSRSKLEGCVVWKYSDHVFCIKPPVCIGIHRFDCFSSYPALRWNGVGFLGWTLANGVSFMGSNGPWSPTELPGPKLGLRYQNFVK